MMTRKYYKLSYEFIMENLTTNKNFINFVKTRALGVARPAFEIITNGLDSNGEIFSYYKDCVRQALKIINAVGNRNYVAKNILDKVSVEDFANLVEDCYHIILEYLHSNDSTLLMKDRKEIVLIWCGDFRYCFSVFEQQVKKICINQLPFYQKELDFSNGVLVRSVNDLSIHQGFWGIDYPIISTSIFMETKPNWYLKGQRNVMLVYSIDNIDDVVAMFPTDSNTICSVNLEKSNDAYVEKLLLDDLVEDAWFSVLYPDYQCAYTWKQLTAGTDICEIVLKNSIRPKAILIGDLTWYKQNKKVQFETEVFATYYGLPILALSGGKISKLQNFLLNSAGVPINP